MSDDVRSGVSKFVGQIKSFLFEASTTPDEIRRLFSNTSDSVRQRAIHDAAQLLKEHTKQVCGIDEADFLIVDLFCADSSEELFLELMAIAEVSRCSHDDFFRMIKLSNVCRGMMTDVRKASSSAWICESVVRRAKNVKPENYDETNEDVLEKDSDPAGTVEITYRAILDEVRGMTSEARNSSILKSNLIQCVVSLFGEPLALLPFNLNKYFEIAEELFNHIVIFKIDPLYILVHTFNASKIALGVFGFYLFSKVDNLDHISHVYSPNFVLTLILNLSSAMIMSDQPPIQQKGLLLVSFGLRRVENLTWSETYDYLRLLGNLMVFNQMKDLRRLAVQVFDSIYSHFTEDSAYCLLLNARHLSEDSGFLGHVITKIKTLVVNTNAKFHGKLLEDLLRVYCTRPTVFHSSTDVVLSTLNLVRFLLVFRGDVGISLWLSEELETAYLEPLREALRDATKETREHRHELSSSQKSGNVSASDDKNKPEMSLVVSGQALPTISTEEKIQMLESSLTKFELIEDIMLRIDELLLEYKQRFNKASA